MWKYAVWSESSLVGMCYCLQVVEIILDGKEVTVQDVLRHQRWRPTTRSARHKLAKFVKDHEHLLRPDPDSPEGGASQHFPMQSRCNHLKL